ncbi:MAG: PDZ domain-containing protein [Chloroflexota bacterium]|nr:PDZ domain-containing protein [Chloroflexota bacterium]
MQNGGGQARHGALGAKVADAGGKVLPGGIAVQGALVGGVNPGSAAEAAGLRTGDVITAVDGRAISSADELATALRGQSGKGMTLSLRRGTGERNVLVQL